MGDHAMSDVLVGCGLAQVPDPRAIGTAGTGVPLVACREGANRFAFAGTACAVLLVVAAVLILGGIDGQAIAAIGFAFAAVGAGRAGWLHRRRVEQLGDRPPTGWYEVQPDRAMTSATLLAGAPLALPVVIFMSIDGVVPALALGSLIAVSRLGYLAGYWTVTARSAAAISRTGRGRALMPASARGARVIYVVADDAG